MRADDIDAAVAAFAKVGTGNGRGVRALVKARAEAGLWMEEVDEPEVADDEVKIAVTMTSICGTDLHIFRWDEWAQETILGADDDWPRVHGHHYGSRVCRCGSRDRPARFRRGSHHLRPLPKLPRWQQALLPQPLGGWG